jgi:hypothetical protein
MADDSAWTPNNELTRLAGTWEGTNGFRLMPSDELHRAPSTASVTSAAGGHDVVVAYTWTHPQDGPQDGIMLVGSPDEDGTVTTAWGDSWHQQPAIRTFSGTLDSGRLEVTADYGAGWLWTITVEGDDPLVLTMYNVVPAEYGTDETPAGPYPAMIAELRRVAPDHS